MLSDNGFVVEHYADANSGQSRVTALRLEDTKPERYDPTTETAEGGFELHRAPPTWSTSAHQLEVVLFFCCASSFLALRARGEPWS